jgi:amino acid transporter
MRKSIFQKIFITILTILILIIWLSPMTLANYYRPDGKGGNTQSRFNPDKWDPRGEMEDTELLSKAGSNIIGVIRVVGIVVSVITLSIVGIKYMMGSVEEKKKKKKTMIPYLIGSVMLFASTFIIGLIYDFASNL